MPDPAPPLTCGACWSAFGVTVGRCELPHGHQHAHRATSEDGRQYLHWYSQTDYWSSFVPPEPSHDTTP